MQQQILDLRQVRQSRESEAPPDMRPVSHRVGPDLPRAVNTGEREFVAPEKRSGAWLSFAVHSVGVWRSEDASRARASFWDKL